MFRLLLVLLAFSLIHCSKSDTTINTTPVTTTQRIQAATTTSLQNSLCTSITPFYWEIGNADQVLASGSTGDGSIVGSTVLPIASATKLLFASYVVQKLNGSLSASTIKHLTMTAGYTSFGNLSCSPNSIQTVLDCYNAGTNSTYTGGHDGSFYYNGGHFQKWGVDNSMSNLNEAQLETEFQSYLGSEISFTFGSPQLAGGVSMSATEYGQFLRKVLSSELLINNFLGAHAVCTGSSCPTSISSPMTENFHYSLGHWVEDDTSVSDGAFSSAGLFGFYPWIDSTKTFYGVLSRYQVPSGGNDIGSGYASLLCGRIIRKAFLTGVVQ